MIPVEITQTPWHFTTWLNLFDHWQTVIAGFAALIAALIAVGGSEWRARKAVRAMLASEARLYVGHLIKAREMLKRLEPSFLNGARRQHDLRDLAVLLAQPASPRATTPARPSPKPLVIFTQSPHAADGDATDAAGRIEAGQDLMELDDRREKRVMLMTDSWSCSIMLL